MKTARVADKARCLPTEWNLKRYDSTFMQAPFGVDLNSFEFLKPRAMKSVAWYILFRSNLA